jgi:hypothetical protein
VSDDEREVQRAYQEDSKLECEEGYVGLMDERGDQDFDSDDLNDSDDGEITEDEAKARSVIYCTSCKQERPYDDFSTHMQKKHTAGGYVRCLKCARYGGYGGYGAAMRTRPYEYDDSYAISASGAAHLSPSPSTSPNSKVSQ